MIKTQKYPNEFDVLWETVIITGDSHDEVKDEVSRIIDDSDNAQFIRPFYSVASGKWIATGHVLKPH